MTQSNMRRRQTNISWFALALFPCGLAALGQGCAPSEDGPMASIEFGAGEVLACATACGDETATLDGVPMRSNGPDMGTGTACGGTVATGLAWQCVEGARRYVEDTSDATLPRVNFASDFCSITVPGFVRYSTGEEGFSPEHGDLAVSEAGTFGHIAIVDVMVDSNVRVVEQNASCGGTRDLALTYFDCFLRRE